MLLLMAYCDLLACLGGRQWAPRCVVSMRLQVARSCRPGCLSAPDAWRTACMANNMTAERMRAAGAQQSRALHSALGGRKRKASDVLGAESAPRQAKRGATLLARMRSSLLLAQLWLSGVYQVPTSAACTGYKLCVQALYYHPASISYASVFHSSTRILLFVRCETLHHACRRWLLRCLGRGCQPHTRPAASGTLRRPHLAARPHRCWAATARWRGTSMLPAATAARTCRALRMGLWLLSWPRSAQSCLLMWRPADAHPPGRPKAAPGFSRRHAQSRTQGCACLWRPAGRCWVRLMRTRPLRPHPSQRAPTPVLLFSSPHLQAA